MKFPPIIKSFPHFLHGGDYNPDQWLGHPEVIDEDFRLIKLAGCNTFSVGIFSWSSPQEPIWKSANFAGSSQIEKTPFPARFEKSCTPFAPSSKTSSILNSPTILADLILMLQSLPLCLNIAFAGKFFITDRNLIPPSFLPDNFPGRRENYYCKSFLYPLFRQPISVPIAKNEKPFLR